MNQSLFCARCGTLAEPEDAFCVKCGGPLMARTEQPVESLTATAEAAVSVPSEPATASETVAPVAPPAFEASPVWFDASTTPTSLAVPGQVTVVAPSVPWSVHHAVARRRFLPVLAAVLAIALVGTAAFFVVTTNNLNSQLSDTKSQLANASSQLTDTKSQLANTSNQLQAAHSQVTTLQEQVQQQTSCIAALTSSSAELSHVSSLMQANFNATAKGSAWATASAAWGTAMEAANTDYYNAFYAAFHGQLTKANSWVSKGNAQISLANAANTKMTSASDGIDAATAEIESEVSTFNTNLASAQATCGFSQVTSG